MPYAIDLFCGAGGFSEGILQAGFDIIFSSDKSTMAQETYTNRHRQLGIREGIDTHFELADIKELTADRIFESINSLRYGNIFRQGNIDAIFGGPPCQGFSRLGKRDATDPRNMLFHEYLRIIRDIRPKYVVMENVTGIIDMNMLDFPSVLDNRIYEGQHVVPEILRQELEGLNYNVLPLTVLNAADFGVPQQRNRAVFLAYRNDVAPLEYPHPNENIRRTTVHDAFGDLYNGDNNYVTAFSTASMRGRTPNVYGNPIPRENVTNMETSRHDEIVRDRFSLYRQGEKLPAVVARIKNEGIDLENDYAELFYNSLYTLNRETNVEIIKEQLKLKNLLPDKINSSWLLFTNKILSKIDTAQDSVNVIHSLARRLNITDEQAYNLWEDIPSRRDIPHIPQKDDFMNEIHVLARRLNITDKQAHDLWRHLRLLLNKNITHEELSQALKNGNITEEIAVAVFTKKNVRIRLDENDVSPTVVTLPDDYIHPFFNRVLTVREMARLQSFDDSFVFLGKRTTGGSKRRLETPQFTQVGNAVPPLLARAIAESVLNSLNHN